MNVEPHRPRAPDYASEPNSEKAVLDGREAWPNSPPLDALIIADRPQHGSLRAKIRNGISAAGMELEEAFASMKHEGPRMLGVLLCYNDADILPDVICALREAGHNLIVWDHGSDDGTDLVLDRYKGELVERRLAQLAGPGAV